MEFLSSNRSGYADGLSPNCDSNSKIRNRNKKRALQHHTGITCDNRGVLEQSRIDKYIIKKKKSYRRPTVQKD